MGIFETLRILSFRKGRSSHSSSLVEWRDSSKKWSSKILDSHQSKQIICQQGFVFFLTFYGEVFFCSFWGEFWPRFKMHGDLTFPSGDQPVPPGREAWRLDQWATREVSPWWVLDTHEIRTVWWASILPSSSPQSPLPWSSCLFLPLFTFSSSLNNSHCSFPLSKNVFLKDKDPFKNQY